LDLAHEDGRQCGERVAGSDLVGAVGGEQEHGQIRAAARQEAEEIEGGGVGPVQILQQQDQRVTGGEGGEVVQAAPHDGVLVDRGFAVTRGGEQRRRQGGQPGVARSPIEHLAPGAIGRGLGAVVAPTDENERPLPAGLGEQGLGEGGLADARLAADEDEGAAPGQRRGEYCAHGRQLVIAANEGGLVWCGIRSLVHRPRFLCHRPPLCLGHGVYHPMPVACLLTTHIALGGMEEPKEVTNYGPIAAQPCGNGMPAVRTGIRGHTA